MEEMSSNIFQMVRSLNVLIDRGEKAHGEKWKVPLDGGSQAYPKRRAQEGVMK